MMINVGKKGTVVSTSHARCSTPSDVYEGRIETIKKTSDSRQPRPQHCIVGIFERGYFHRLSMYSSQPQKKVKLERIAVRCVKWLLTSSAVTPQLVNENASSLPAVRKSTTHSAETHLTHQSQQPPPTNDSQQTHRPQHLLPSTPHHRPQCTCPPHQR